MLAASHHMASLDCLGEHTEGNHFRLKQSLKSQFKKYNNDDVMQNLTDGKMKEEKPPRKDVDHQLGALVHAGSCLAGSS